MRVSKWVDMRCTYVFNVILVVLIIPAHFVGPGEENLALAQEFHEFSIFLRNCDASHLAKLLKEPFPLVRVVVHRPIPWILDFH